MNIINKAKLKIKRAKCNFYRKKSNDGLFTDWCNGKDSYCDGWCTC